MLGDQAAMRVEGGEGLKAQQPSGFSNVEPDSVDEGMDMM